MAIWNSSSFLALCKVNGKKVRGRSGGESGESGKNGREVVREGMVWELDSWVGGAESETRKGRSTQTYPPPSYVHIGV